MIRETSPWFYETTVVIWFFDGWFEGMYAEFLENVTSPLAPFKGGLMRLMNFEGKMKDFSFLNI